MTAPTPADELRAAAAKVRRNRDLFPTSAEDIAGWLETEAVMWEQRGNSPEGQTFHALKVARAVNGSAPVVEASTVAATLGHSSPDRTAHVYGTPEADRGPQ